MQPADGIWVRERRGGMVIDNSQTRYRSPGRGVGQFDRTGPGVELALSGVVC